MRDKETQHQKVYEEVIKKKKTLDVLSIRFVNFGIPRSGKTTFWHRMMDPSAKMNDHEPSTGLVDEQKPVLIKNVKTNTGMVTGNEWYILDSSGYARMLIEVFSQEVDIDEADVSTPLAADPMADLKADKLASDLDNQSVFSSLFKKAEQSHSDWEAIKCKLENMILLNTADTGGHVEFLDMHPALINGPSFNLLFSRLTENFDESFKVYYTDKNSESSPAFFSTATVKEVMFQALSSIVCLGNVNVKALSDKKFVDDLASQESKVMFVGTYADKVDDAAFKAKDAELQHELKVVKGSLTKAIMYASIENDEKQLMLKVDNVNGGKAEIDEIRGILKKKFKSYSYSWFLVCVGSSDS